MSSPLALPGVDFAPRADADSDDQHTPPWLVAEVVAFFGGIDTDPAWSPESHVRAVLTYDGLTPEQDGLAQPWRGKVWANVPYSNPTPYPNAGVPKRSKQKFNPDAARRHNRFPLIERRLCRCRAVALVRRLGYPVPRKSACMGCCYNSMTDWQTLEREVPEAFAAFAELEARKPPTSSGVKLSITGFRMMRPRAPRPEAMTWVTNLDGY